MTEDSKSKAEISKTKPLEINRRLIGSSAIVSQALGENDITVRLDVEGMIRRLILFDTYILHSVRLKEIPELVKHFGYDGTLALLNSGALEIRCECAQFAEGFTNPACPPLTLQFHVIEAHIRDQYLLDSLASVNRTPGLSSRELMNLQTAVVKAVRQPDNRAIFSEFIAPTFEADVLHNKTLLKSAVRFVLEKKNAIRNLDNFELRFHKVGDDRYKAETNLSEKLALSPEELHNVLKTAVLGVSGVDQRLGEMRAHTALSGFTEEELPLFRAKLASIADAVGSAGQERRFQRVVSLSGLSQFSEDDQIDIVKLLEIRNQPEALEFRAWLAGIDQLTDKEIASRVSGFNAKLGLAATRGTGKTIRVLVQTAAGLVPGLGVVLGPTFSALDEFVWDKFARRSGIAAFVHELYPSIFSEQ